MQTRTKLSAALLASVVAVGVAYADGSAKYGSTGASGATGSTAPQATPAPDANRGVKQTADDATITGKVKAALIRDDLVKARNINVDTVRGVVKLSGTVANDSEKQQALNLARQTSGVVEVQSNLSVGTP